jgi:hypothetical protein
MKIEKKTKGKARLGIAMTVIMLASVFALMIGGIGAYSVGGAYNIIEKAGIQAVIIGQDLDFSEDWTEIVTVSRVIYDEKEWSITADAQNHLHVSENETQWTNPGAFYVNYNTSDGTREAQLAIGAPNRPLALKVGIMEVTTIVVGTNLKIDTGGMNLFWNDRVDLVIIGPDGQIKYDVINDQQFTNISVAQLNEWYGGSLNELVTAGWTIGDYTFQVKTKSAYACGLSAESAVKDLEIGTGAIEIDADKTSAVELEMVTLTVTGVVGDEIEVYGDSADVEFKRGIMDTPWQDSKYKYKYYWFYDTIDADGMRRYAVEFIDTGTYTITVTVTGPVGNPRIGDYDTVDITVSEKGVEFDLPSIVVIGERITIRGTATSGTYVSVYIDDVLYRQLQDLVLEDGEFSKEVTTTEVGMTIPGSVRLKAWIDCECKVPLGNDSTTDKPTRTSDGETAILLTAPGLTVELSPTVVALEDDFTIEGTAKGSTEVVILSVPPKGGGGNSLLDKGETGLSPRKASVSLVDGTFSKNLTVQEDATPGYYDIYVLSSGMDGEWDMTGEASLVEAIKIRYGINITDPADIGTKTQEDIHAILVDLTTCAGSDDLMWGGSLKVVSTFDTCSGTYPSIFGTHNGTITPYHDLNISKIYTYPCPGTGGHSESVAFYNETTGEEIANGTWNGYQGDWHNITLHNVTGAPYVRLLKEHKYNYTIRTGSYPQIIHAKSKDVTVALINCTEFTDANGKTYTDWIPAIRLE